jgi:hypothetical protein
MVNKASFYYLRKHNDYFKCGLGAKLINPDEQTLNFIFETRKPYHIKGKIDNKLNMAVTISKDFQMHESLSTLSYGISLSNLWGKKTRIQSGIVYEFNA